MNIKKKEGVGRAKGKNQQREVNKNTEKKGQGGRQAHNRKTNRFAGCAFSNCSDISHIDVSLKNQNRETENFALTPGVYILSENFSQ